MRVIIMNNEGAEAVRGNYGIYSAIDPVPLPNGNYMIPERCLEDPDLADAAGSINSNITEISDVLDLPEIGEQCIAGKIYKYIDTTGNIEANQSGLVFCVQTHSRTIYPPFETPALFSFFRENSDTLEWIPNEHVQVGWIRIYNGKQYTCLQAHQTLTSWTPDVTAALWQEIITTPEVQEWVQPTGAHNAYNIGDRVLFMGLTYESLINANVWSPTAYPAGWRLIQ